MKIMLIVFLFGSTLIAQPQAFKHTFSPNKIPNSQDIHNMVADKIMNRSDSQLITEIGRPTREEWQMWNGSVWENNWALENVYGAGKVKTGQFTGQTMINFYTWLSGAWSQTGYNEYVYDDQGNLIQIIVYTGSVAYSRFTYSGPFTNGQPTEMLDEYYDTAWRNNFRFIYTYDANGCIIDEIMQWWNGSAWENWMRTEYYYSQVCCPERWVFSYWNGSAWVINYLAMFMYGYANCMTDLEPFAALMYLCNPTLVLMGTTINGIDMLVEEWRDELTYTNCLTLTYLSTYLGVIQWYTTYAHRPLGSGKVSDAFDNSNQRLTNQITQIPSGNNLVNSTRTWYSYEGLELSAENEVEMLANFSLNQNYPNPFNPSTTITFDLSESTNVKILIYDMSGGLIRELVNNYMNEGSKTISWNGKDDNGNVVSGGVYFYNIQAGDFSQTRKMVLMK